MLLSISFAGLTNILCQWSVKKAKRFDEDLQSLEDFNQYIKTVRKLYNRPKFAPDNTEGIFVNTFSIRGGFEVEDLVSQMSRMATPAACIPEKTVVPVTLPRDEDNLSISVFPSCTRLDRCGGCCSHPLLSCQPTREETVSLEVLVVDNRDFSDSVQTVNMTQHTECGCQCITKEADCNHLQDIFRTSAGVSAQILMKRECVRISPRQSCGTSPHAAAGVWRCRVNVRLGWCSALRPAGVSPGDTRMSPRFISLTILRGDR